MKVDITNLKFLGITLKKAKTLDIKYKLNILYFFIYKTFFIANKENACIKIIEYSDGDFFIIRAKHAYNISINNYDYNIENAIVLDGIKTSELNIRYRYSFQFFVETNSYTSKLLNLNDNKHCFLNKIKHIIFNENYCSVNIDILLENCFMIANLRQWN